MTLKNQKHVSWALGPSGQRLGKGHKKNWWTLKIRKKIKFLVELIVCSLLPIFSETSQKNALLIIRENDIHFKGFQKILNFIFQLALYPMSSREIEKKEECADGMKELPYI